MPIVALDNFLEDEPPLFGPFLDCCLELGVFAVVVLAFGLAVPGFHIIVVKVIIMVSVGDDARMVGDLCSRFDSSSSRKHHHLLHRTCSFDVFVGGKKKRRQADSKKPSDTLGTR